MNLPEKIFNLPVVVKGTAKLKGYPNVYTHAYDCLRAAIGGVSCFVFESKGAVKPLQVSKMFESVSSNEGLPCLLACPALSAYQRRSLSERCVAWLKDKDTFHIPFLMASCNVSRSEARAASALSAEAQHIALRAIDGSWDGMTSTDVAERIGKSLSSVSSYFAEIAAVEPKLIGKKGRTRYIVSPATAEDKSTTFDSMERYMSSPVKRRVLLASDGNDEVALDGFPLSGISSLSNRTLIAPDAWATRAVARSDKKTLETIDRCVILENVDEGEPYVEIEIWAYEPEEDDMLSLYLDAREMAADEGDDRLQQAAMELKEMIFVER